jgi:DNA-binding response OmpR family regulator
VDDELDLREMVAEYLMRNGFRARTAMDGETMIEKIKFATDSPLERNGLERQFRAR